MTPGNGIKQAELNTWINCGIKLRGISRAKGGCRKTYKEIEE
jgi:hypothetical protein